MSDTAAQESSFQAADTDRIQAAQLLTDAAAQGQLDVDEYERRLVRAYGAQTYRELDQLSADLPGFANTRRGACRPAPATVLLAIMSAFERRGRWYVPPKLTTFTLWGGGVVDLRYAEFTSPIVEIRAYSIMGGHTFLLPPEVNVHIKGIGVMGGFGRNVDSPGILGAPDITIKGFSLLGGIGVKRKQRRR
jgi:Domain of unknown function (DUF1707)